MNEDNKMKTLYERWRDDSKNYILSNKLSESSKDKKENKDENIHELIKRRLKESNIPFVDKTKE